MKHYEIDISRWWNGKSNGDFYSWCPRLDQYVKVLICHKIMSPSKILLVQLLMQILKWELQLNFALLYYGSVLTCITVDPIINLNIEHSISVFYVLHLNNNFNHIKSSTHVSLLINCLIALEFSAEVSTDK